MNTRIIIAFASLWILLGFQACTKQELITVNEPVELDENSIQYQQYMVERATELIKAYRFDQLGNTIDRIKDPTERQKVLALLTEYRDRAFNEALYYATPSGDTIFFFPPGIDSRLEAKRLYISNLYQKAVVNEIGVLHGFKNFPAVETVDMGNSLATGIKDLNGLPELKTFNWTFVPYYFGEFYPDVELAPVPLEFDFSENKKLEKINIHYVDLVNLKFPENKIPAVNFGSAIVNSADEIDRIAANSINITGTSTEEGLALKSKNIDSLILNLTQLKVIDIGESEILNLRISLIEQLTLNNKIEKLTLFAENIKQKPAFPNSLKELTISSYPLSDKDFSTASGLKKMTWGGAGYNDLILPNSLEELTVSIPHPYSPVNYDYSNLSNLKKITIQDGDFDQATIQFPLNLESLTITSSGRRLTINGDGDYSHLINLNTFAVKLATVSKMPQLPSSISKLELLFVHFKDDGEVDLSHLTNLGSFLLQAQSSEQPVTLILPGNISEAALQAGAASINATQAIFIPVGSTVVDAPNWMLKYIRYL